MGGSSSVSYTHLDVYKRQRVYDTDNMDIGRIGILGSGSWATALAKISLESTPEINWYVRRDDQVQRFKATGHNPDYLSSAAFEDVYKRQAMRAGTYFSGETHAVSVRFVLT